MTQEINPTYTTFEQSKLLKSKSIEIDTEEVLIYIDEVNNTREHQLKNRNDVWEVEVDNVVDENEYRLYHQWQIIEWLRLEHNIFIQVVAEVYVDGINYSWNTINLAPLVLYPTVF